MINFASLFRAFITPTGDQLNLYLKSLGIGYHFYQGRYLSAIKEVLDTDELMIITTQGVLIRQAVSKIRAIGRATQGVKLINLDKGAAVASITRIISDEEKKEEDQDESDKKEPKEA